MSLAASLAVLAAVMLLVLWRPRGLAASRRQARLGPLPGDERAADGGDAARALALEQSIFAPGS